eukprot:GHVR01011251.1.p1 GENE.GHVR01011251.1~~GHVR01011251.1.p1  ORF type:complete len:143 (+),score=58.58 GHVR01011251.1:3-431(+)
MEKSEIKESKVFYAAAARERDCNIFAGFLLPTSRDIQEDLDDCRLLNLNYIFKKIVKESGPYLISGDYHRLVFNGCHIYFTGHGSCDQCRAEFIVAVGVHLALKKEIALAALRAIQREYAMRFIDKALDDRQADTHTHTHTH